MPGFHPNHASTAPLPATIPTDIPYPHAKKKQPLRRALFLLLQMAVTAGILAYVFRDSQQRSQMAAALRSADLRWIALAIVVYSGVEALGAVRWCILLRVEGFRADWYSSLRQLLTAMFFNLYSPGLIGGDVIRLFYLAGEQPHRKPAALAAIFMDRMIGAVSLLFLAVITLALRYSWLTGTSAAAWLVKVTILSLVGMAAAIIVVFAATFYGRCIPRSFPFSDKLSEVVESFRRYRNRTRSLAVSLGVTLAAHVLYYLTYYCAARAMYHGEQVIGLADIFSIMPIVNTLVSLPVSFAGIGVREVIFETMLGGLLGANSAVAVLIASTGFLVYAFWGMIGGLFFLVYPPKQMES